MLRTSPIALSTLVLATVLALTTAATAQAPPPSAPPLPAISAEVCADRALLCPDLVMAPPTRLEIDRSPGGRTILRAENRIVNVGRGPLEVRARRGPDGSFSAAEQVIRRVGGRSPLRIPGSGRVTFKFVDALRGSYWKYDDALRFELWSLDAEGDRDRQVRTGPKSVSCFRDLDRVRDTARTPGGRVYGACVQRRDVDEIMLGTSVGWADVYPSPYPENWIDVSGLRGCFDFVHRADPGESLTEEREDNNIGVREIALPPRGGSVAPRGRC